MLHRDILHVPKQARSDLQIGSEAGCIYLNRKVALARFLDHILRVSVDFSCDPVKLSIQQFECSGCNMQPTLQLRRKNPAEFILPAMFDLSPCVLESSPDLKLKSQITERYVLA